MKGVDVSGKRSRIALLALLAALAVAAGCEDDGFYVREEPTNNPISREWAGSYSGTGDVLSMVPLSGYSKKGDDVTVGITDLGDNEVRVRVSFSRMDYQVPRLEIVGEMTSLTSMAQHSEDELFKHECYLTRGGDNLSGHIQVLDKSAGDYAWEVYNIKAKR